MLKSYSGPDESVENASSGSPFLTDSCLPLFDLRLPLALPAGGGGARATTLAFCAHLCPDGDGPGPLRCLGSDLDPLSRSFSRSAWYA